MAALTPRDKLKSLEKQRDDLEIEIKDLLEQIPTEFRDTTKKPKYTDNEGYPRGDIDIWSIAEIRKKVVMLQNDHISIMKQMEQLLVDVFAMNNNNNNNNDTLDDNKIEMEQKDKDKINKIVDKKEKNDIIANMKAFISNTDKEENKEEKSNKNDEIGIDLNRLKPFYLIDKIFDNSPSHSAGLKSGDLIIKFGSMTSSNQSPKLMQEIVKQSINKQIPVIIRRNPEGFITLHLTPQKWDGKGLLGCHLTPYTN